jgi:Tol biopolymer transport system component
MRTFVATMLASACVLALSTAASAQADRQGTIAFEGGDGLYLIDANGGEARKIPGTLPRDGDPTWSPDGSKIAFDRGGERRDIYVMDADGSDQRRLTFSPDDDGWPRWAPHGRALTFTSDRDGNFAVYVIDLRRGQARRVAQDAAFSDWGRDGRIRYTNEDGELESVRPYGAERRVDVRASIGDLIGVGISEDDRMLVSGTHPPRRLVTSRVDGGGAKVIFKSAQDIYNPAWSPDGRWITFSMGAHDEHLDVYVIRADGTGLTRLTRNAPEGQACCSDWTSD